MVSLLSFFDSNTGLVYSRSLLGNFSSYSTLLEYLNRMLVDDGPQNKQKQFSFGTLLCQNIKLIFLFFRRSHRGYN